MSLIVSSATPRATKSTSDARLKALAREQFVALAELFQLHTRNRTTTVSLARLTQLALESTYGDLSQERIVADTEKGRVKGIATPKGIIIDASVTQNLSDRRRLRALTGHEVTHRLHDVVPLSVGNNELVTAHAIGKYLSQMPLIRDGAITHQPVSNALQARINQAVVPSAYTTAVQKHGRAKAEYISSIEGSSFADLGRALGLVALHKEHELKQPGVGLFIIRSVVRGETVQEACVHARQGMFERERKVWLARNPRVRSFILREGHPLEFSALRSPIRAKNVRAKQPIRPRTKRWPLRVRTRGA